MVARGVCALVLAVAILGVGSAGATPPGNNGMIAFARTGAFAGRLVANIWVANADGSGARALTATNDVNWLPSWSTDGRMLAFSSNRDGNDEIYVINADGTGLRRLTSDPGLDDDPQWWPIGARIAYRTIAGIVVVNADGTGRRAVTSGGFADPSWSPDGRQLVVSGGGDIHVVSASGGAPRNLTNSPSMTEYGPDWSPDGSTIVFSRVGDQQSADLWVVRVNGTGEVRLTNTGPFRSSGRAAWSPDGTRIVFDSSRDQTQYDYDVYTMAADGSDVRRVTDIRPLGSAIQASWERIARSIDLSVAQRATPKTARLGKTLTLTASVRSRGAERATGVVLTVSPPRSLRVVGAQGAGAVCRRAATVTCLWSSFAGSAAVRITLRPRTAAAAVVTASVAGLDADPNASNNRSRLRVTVRR